jgi:hypothetical protein
MDEYGSVVEAIRDMAAKIEAKSHGVETHGLTSSV